MASPLPGPPDPFPGSVDQYRLLDGARGLAALAVVFFHRGTYLGTPGPLAWLIRYGEVGANIFFVISGYVIYQAAERYGHRGLEGVLAFVRRRVLRIYPAFWASLVIGLILAATLLHAHLSPAMIVRLGTLTTQPPDIAPLVPYWTLYFEQQFYVVIAVLMLPQLRAIRYWLIVASTVLPVVVTRGLISDWVVNSMLPRHWLEFELGILAYTVIQRREPRFLSALLFGLLVLVGFTGDYRTIAASSFAAVIVALHPFDRRIDRLRVLAPIRWLGLVSYSLYLLHTSAFSLVNRVLSLAGVSSASLAHYACGIVAALLAASLFFPVFEKPFLSKRRRTDVEREHRYSSADVVPN